MLDNVTNRLKPVAPPPPPPKAKGEAQIGATAAGAASAKSIEMAKDKKALTGDLSDAFAEVADEPEVEEEASKGFFGGIVDAIGDAAGDVVDTVADAVDTVTDTLAETGYDVLQQVGDVIEATPLDEAADAVRDAVGNVAEQTGLSDLVDRGLEHVVNASEVIAGALGRRDVESKAGAQKDFKTEAEAKQAFERGRDALLDVNNWKQLAPGAENAEFKLYDQSGKPVDRAPREGDFVKIDAPGDPANSDWVRIESAEVTDDRAEIVVRPSHDPTKQPPTPEVIEHFFSEDATNAFSIERDGTRVSSMVHGEHETANTEAAGSPAKALRNQLFAQGAWGAPLPLPLPGTPVINVRPQQHQWNEFTEGLVNR